MIHRALVGDRMPHAYIFHGPEGVGKEAFAMGLAETLLCADPVQPTVESGDADGATTMALALGCGVCVDCRGVTAQTHPDLHLIHRQLNRLHPDAAVRARKALEIGVDVLRHFVLDKVRLTPQRGRKKVFIIRDADRITAQAQNALLKTLEEPPLDTVLILCAAAVDRLLPTTRSRCQLVRFDALPTGFIQERLSELLPDLDDVQAGWYARHGAGSIGRSLQFAADGLYELNSHLLKTLPGLEPGHEARLVELWTGMARTLADLQRSRDPGITETETNRHGLKLVFQLAANYFADVLRGASGDGAVAIHGGTISLPSACRAINRIALAERQLDLNANVQLIVETLSNDLAKLHSGAGSAG